MKKTLSGTKIYGKTEGLQKGAKMEVRSHPETVSEAFPVQNCKISIPYIICCVLTTSGTPENHRFSTLRAPKTAVKVVSKRISKKSPNKCRKRCKNDNSGVPRGPQNRQKNDEKSSPGPCGCHRPSFSPPGGIREGVPP